MAKDIDCSELHVSEKKCLLLITWKAIVRLSWGSIKD